MRRIIKFSKIGEIILKQQLEKNEKFQLLISINKISDGYIENDVNNNLLKENVNKLLDIEIIEEL